MTIFIAASGTGGHILPAVYIAEVLRKTGEDVQFIGAGRLLEVKLIDSRGFNRHIIPLTGVAGLGALGFINFILGAPHALYLIHKIFKKNKPKAVIGVGGYVSVLPILYAWFKGIPTWIHEAEHELGLANKVLAYIATRCSSAYPNLKSPKPKRVVYTGHPVRADLIRMLDDKRIIETPTRILVLGGSQGAKALDEMVPVVLSNRKGISVRHQCREENQEAVMLAYAQAGIDSRVETFINDMTEAYLWSDIIISRAGAGLVMEISVTNRPTIFVPFPFAQGGHQKDNAKVLADAGKALVVEEGDGFKERLIKAVEALLDPNVYKAIRQKAYSPRSLTAAEEIAKGIQQLC